MSDMPADRDEGADRPVPERPVPERPVPEPPTPEPPGSARAGPEAPQFPTDQSLSPL